MIRECIIFTILILVLITKCTNAISDRSVGEHKNTINKCCPFGELPSIDKHETCVKYIQQKFTFSELEVYDENKKKTGKSVKDVFTLIPGRFDTTFKAEALKPYTDIETNEYIIENGMLFLETPNKYNRWTPIANGNFCVDYEYITEERENPIRIWAIVPEIIDDRVEDANDYYTYTLLVSCFFMLLVLIVYFMLPELQNLAGKILMAYVASLFLAFLLLAIIKLKRHGTKACIGLTLGTYFFLLASVCWMSVMSYDIWTSFSGTGTRSMRVRRRRGELIKFLKYCLCAWGVPLAMAIVLAVLNSVDMRHVPWFVTPNIPDQGCFLMGGVRLLYLHIPMLVLILCNWAFYLTTAFNIWRLNQNTSVLNKDASGKPQAHRANKHRFMVYLKLSVVMGLNWVMEVLSSLYPGFKMWYISDAYNILIGVAIFLIFVCKKKIYVKLCKRYSYDTRDQQHNVLSRARRDLDV